MSLTTKVAKMQSVRIGRGYVTGPGRTGLWNPRQPSEVTGVPSVYGDPRWTSVRQTRQRMGAQGDPGIFGDIGRFIGGAVKSVPLVGGLVGGGITALSNALDPVGSSASPRLPPMATIGINGMPQFQQASTTRKVNLSPLPGNIYESTTTMGPVNGSMSGYHLNKADYFLRDGTFVPKGTKWVKNRRRNPANSKATNRAISRVASAKKHASNLSRVTIRKKSSCK